MTVSSGSFAIGIINDFDLDQIKKNQELGQAAGYVGMRMAGDIAEYEQRQAVNDLIEAKSKNDKAAEADAKARLEHWGSGGRNKVILHGMIGAATAALGGGNAAQGALGAAASEAASGVMQTYLDSHGIKPNSATGNTLMNLASTAIGAAASDGNGAATALYGDKYNRQLHSEEIDWINIHAKAFARQQCNGCDPSAQQIHEARKTLAQQAQRDVDALWRIHMPESDNATQAKNALANAKGTFTNNKGEQQKLFTTEGNQFDRPLLFADEAGPDTIAFYENYIQPGATRDLTDGLKAETSQTLHTIGNNLTNSDWWQATGKQAIDSAEDGWNYLFSTGVYDATADAISGTKNLLTTTGNTLGETAAGWNPGVSQQLNKLYGRDVTAEQRALQGLASTAGVLEATGIGKVATHVGEGGLRYLTDPETGETLHQLASPGLEATGKAARQTGKLVKENRKEITLCALSMGSICLGKMPDDQVTHRKTLSGIRNGIEVNRAIDSSKTTMPWGE